MLNCGERHAHIQETVMTFVEQVRKSERTPLLTCLLEGPGGRYISILGCTPLNAL
jgi:vesicle-fusing ATPase